MQYRVLGPVEAAEADVSLVVGPQQRRLLALLLSKSGESLSSERLVDCLWPDGLAPDGASRSVMTYISRLRAAVGDSSVVTVDEGYRFDVGDAVVDAAVFEGLLADAGRVEPGRAVELYDRALGLWRGAAYGDFGGEWWVVAEASRLNELRVVAMEERAEALLALGGAHRVIPELERLAADHALRERPVSLLMQAMFATGRHADALRRFQAFRDRLGDETGLEPSADLVALERSMVAGRPVVSVNSRARLLRGYVVHDVLGEGAFGRVFAATQPGTNREVAIKAIRPDLSDGLEFIQRFEAEAQLVARLEHPHIVPLYDYWREPGGAYLVFRLLLGGTAFTAMVSEGPFSVSRASRLVEEVGGALLAAHSVGVVHCDIKPSNVLFDEAGNAYLSDFGIAVTSATFDARGPRTRAYAAPELSGRGGDTVLSDIFSFGCMLWELLVGVSPFAVMQPAARLRVPSLAGSLSEPCEAIDAVLARATAADAAARFESMAELIVAWREAVGRPEGVLTPVNTPTAKAADAAPNSSRRRAVRALTATVSAAVNPYKGLRSFSEADAADFFGRDDVARALCDTLAARELVAVVGPSGSGKSSLVHAGLVPLLRRDGVRVVTMVPGDRPMPALREALRQVATADIVGDDPSQMFRAAACDGAGRLVLVVDQFEECWTLSDNLEREKFLTAVTVAGQHGISCVVTVRADLYDRPLQHTLIGQMIADGTFALPPLSPQALEEAVVRPANRHGIDFEDGVVTAIVAEANAQPAGLPLLQFALAELYEHRDSNRITTKTLDDLGGLAGAIGRRAEEIYTSLDDPTQTQTRQLFGRLVSAGHGAPDTRRRARHSELSAPARAVADRFVDARLLVADRDLATREPVIEVAHEALLTNWPRLREWLEADRRWLVQLQHLATATRNWDDTGHADSELYRGSRLEAALEALPERAIQLNPAERNFIDASRNARDLTRERERRNTRRLRRLLISVASLLVIAIIAGTIAEIQRHRADTQQHRAIQQQNAAIEQQQIAVGQKQIADQQTLEANKQKSIAEGDKTSAIAAAAQAQQSATQAKQAKTESELTTLASRSLSLRSSQRDLAALLAVEAWKRSPDANSKAALFGTFTFDPGFLGYLPFAGPTYGNAIPNTTKMLITTYDTSGASRPRVLDVVTGQTGIQLDPIFDGQIPQLNRAISGDGRDAAVWAATTPDGLSSSVAAVFDLATGHAIGPTIQLNSYWDSLALNDTGSQLAVETDSSGAADIYDTHNGQLLAHLLGVPGAPISPAPAGNGALAYGPDGRLYLGSRAGHLRVFDSGTFKMVADIAVPPDSTSLAIQLSPDGTTMVAQGVNDNPIVPIGSIIRVDLTTNKEIWSFGGKDYPNGECAAFTFSTETEQLWCGNYFGVIHEHSMLTGQRTGRTLENQRGRTNNLELLKVAGGTMLVATNPNADAISRWFLDGSGPIQKLVAADHGTDHHVVVSDLPDGKTLLVGTPNGNEQPLDLDYYTLWDTVTDTAVSGLPNFRFARSVGNVIFGLFADQTVGTYDVATKIQTNFAYKFEGLATAEAASSDGTLILIGYDTGRFVELNVKTGKTVFTQQLPPNSAGYQPGVDALAITADDSTIYVDGKGLFAYDAATGRELHHNDQARSVNVFVSAQGVIVATSVDGTIGIYDPNSLIETASLPGARGLIEHIRFSNDGTILAAASDDGSVSIYDVQTRVRLGDPIPIGNPRGEGGSASSSDQCTVAVAAV